ncbi:MAG: TlpA disulfide reductase family protein [Agriterribacter sp.]
MKKYLISIFSLLLLHFWLNANSQNVLIRDTVYNPGFLPSDSSFFVEGYVNGVDSGSFSMSIKNTEYSVPVRGGKFYIYGISHAIDEARYQVKGDYYVSFFYIETGKIKIECDTIKKTYRTTGTKENDASNHFHYSLANPLYSKFYNLRLETEKFLDDQNIDEYLKVIDSFPIVQKEYISVIEDAINKKLFGYYLLGAINSYEIRGGFFQERKMLFNKLPEYLRASEWGRQAYAYLEKTENEHKNKPVTYTSPQLSLRDNLGKTFNLEKYYGKKIIVLDLWASWCIPCIKALPMLKKIQQLNISKNVQFVSISIDKNRDDWIKAEEKVKIPWISLITDDIAIKKYDINAVPAYFIIDKQGNMKSLGSSIADLYNSIKNASADKQ